MWCQRKSTRHKKDILLCLIDLLHNLEKKNFRKTNDTRIQALLKISDVMQRYEHCPNMKKRWHEVFSLLAHLLNEDGAYRSRFVFLINLICMHDHLFVANFCERDNIIHKLKKQKLYSLAKDYRAFTTYLYEKRKRKMGDAYLRTLSHVCRKI